MMRKYIYVCLMLFVSGILSAQTLDEARNMYRAGRYAEAMPVFEKQLKKKPKSATLNQWYGVCLYETGERARAEKYLKIAVAGKIPSAYRYLGDICYEQYRFVEAVNYYTRYIEYLDESEDEDIDTEAYETLITHAELGAQKLSKVQNVQVIDSMIVDKERFFTHYRLSSEAGALLDYTALVADAAPAASPAYRTQRGDKIIYAVTTTMYGCELVARSNMGDGTYGEEEPFDDLSTPYDENYPFLMSDGVTLYYASNDEDLSLGGYDIVCTTYNIVGEEYNEPEALPMPFNSPYNDYMMAIDEYNGVGWFVSDRFQPEGKLVIYLYIYEESPRVLSEADTPDLISRAKISSIRDTWQPDVDYSTILAQINKIETTLQPVQQESKMSFAITDDIVYTDLSQFRNKEARAIYLKAQEARRLIKGYETELRKLREEYVGSNNRQAIANRIGEVEKLLIVLYPQPAEFERQSRATEITALSVRK